MTDRLLLAESGPSIYSISGDLNVRFREKRTLHCRFRDAQNNAEYLSVQMTALPPQADVRLEWLKRAAYDPKRTFRTRDLSQCETCMYERFKRALIPALVIAALSTVGFQQNIIPLWAAFLGLTLAVLVATIIFMRND